MVINVSNKKKKKVLLIALIFICCLLSAGYLVLINGLVINGKLKFGEPKFDVRFTSIHTTNVIGDAKNFARPKLTPTEITFYAEFKNYKDSLTYDIEIKNVGNVTARLENIDFVPEDLKYIDYQFTGVMVGDTLKPKETRKVRVKLTNNSEEELDEQISETKLVLTWQQYDY